MARKLKKSALSGLKEKQTVNIQQAQAAQAKAAEILQQIQQLMNVGQVADAITATENLLAARLPLNPAQQAQIRELMTYFVERSLKRMTIYPHILQFMGVKPVSA